MDDFYINENNAMKTAQNDMINSCLASISNQIDVLKQLTSNNNDATLTHILYLCDMLQSKIAPIK